ICNLLSLNVDCTIHDVQKCISIAFNGRVRPIDVVAVELVYEDGSEENMVSVVIAGAGFDAEIMHSTSDRLKAAAGWLAYTEAGMRKLRGKRHTVTVVPHEGEPKRYRVRSAMLANCGVWRGGMNMVPDAVFDDGLLDVVLLGPRILVDWIQVAAAATVPRGQASRVTTCQTRSCKLVFEEPVVAQIDGDPID